MTIREEMAQEREQDALNALDDAKERIGQLEVDRDCAEEHIGKLVRELADMTKLACDYKEANTRLEAEMRELLHKDDGRTREHNLLVQENRKLKERIKLLNFLGPDFHRK